MQDKDLHTDRNFTDRAWKEMQFLLDKEMPVEEKDKKRPILFWLSGVSGMAALIVGIYFINFSEIPVEKQINNNERSIILSESENNKLDLNKEPIDQSTFNKNREEKNVKFKSDNNHEKINTTIIAKDSSSNSIEPQPIALQNHLFKSNEKNKINSDKTSENNSSLITENTKYKNEFSQINLNNNKFHKPENKITPDHIQPKIHLPQLNKIKELTVQEIKYSHKINPVPLKESNIKKHLKNTIYASNLFMTGSKSHGVSVGYLRDIKAINTNWKVNAGISYKYIAQPIEYTLTEAPLDSTGFGSNELTNDFLIEVGYGGNTTSRLLDSNGDPVSFSSGTSDISFNKLKLHYLTFPVNIQYQKNRFWFNGGIQASILLVAKNSSLTGGIAKEIGWTKDASEANFFNVNNSGRSNPSIPDLSNFDFSTSLGIGYSLTKNLDIHISYLHSLKDVIKNNLNKDYNRHFQLSMQYSW